MEATTTLANTLLEDLDDLSDIGGDDDDYNNRNDDFESHNRQMLVDQQQNDDDDEVMGVITSPQQTQSTKQNDILHPRLLNDNNIQKHLDAIRKVMLTSSSSSSSNSSSQGGNETLLNNNTNHVDGKEDRDIEYQLIVKSNKHLLNLSNELIRVHRLLCLSYKMKFAELEELVPNPIQYTKAIRIIGNEMDMTRITDQLTLFLTNNQIITISVAGSTTNGRPLYEWEINQVNILCSYIEDIVNIQNEILIYVQSKMEQLLPNICILLNSTSITAKLLGLAGGFEELTKIPSCNLQVLGQTKYNTMNRNGLSSSSSLLKVHQGILNECDLVQNVSKNIQMKVLKMVSSKLALAIRCDYINLETGRTRTAESGRRFRDEIEQKINKLQEPDKAQVLKALPKPDLEIKKRRGGKRMRRLKERYEETAMMKQANTRAFSAQVGEYGDDAMGRTLGLLDTAEISAGGALRKNIGEKKKMKLANTRESRKRTAQMNAKASKYNHGTNSMNSSSSSGLASSMVFTPVQGMELINPDANKERVKQANRMWFNDNAGFQSAKPSK